MQPAALKRKDAAAYLGMGVKQFDSSVRPHIPAAYVGRLVLYRRRDLDRWLDAQVCG